MTTMYGGGTILPRGHGCATTTGEDTGGEEGERGTPAIEEDGAARADDYGRREKGARGGDANNETTIKQCLRSGE